MSNRFHELSVDEVETNHKKNQRRARKALIAIAKLKKNWNLTPEEQIKVDTEDHWYKILDPSYVNLTANLKNKETEKQRELREKKKIQKNEQKRKERELKNKQREQKRRRDEEGRREFNQEQKRRRDEEYRREFNEEHSKYWKQYHHKFWEQLDIEENSKSNEEKQLDIEYTVLIASGNSQKNAKRKMQIKYHPDKNRDSNTTTKIQYVNNL